MLSRIQYILKVKHFMMIIVKITISLMSSICLYSQSNCCNLVPPAPHPCAPPLPPAGFLSQNYCKKILLHLVFLKHQL